jgi:predicted flap endonuclease-1-like 5' DNA nuclease
MSPFLVGLLLVLAGLAGVFWGYRIFRILLPIVGGIAGYLIAAALFPNSLFLAIVIGIILVVGLAILAYLAWSVLVTISGAILGGAIGAAIAQGLNLWTWLGWILVIVLGAVGAYLVWKIRDEVVIILTAIVGAGFVASGLRVWFGSGVILTWLWIVIFVLLAGIGIVWQWRRYRHLRLLAFGGPAEEPGAPPAAEPAPTRTAPAVEAGAAAEAPPAAAVGAAAVAAGAVAATAEEPSAEAAPAAEAEVPAAAVGAAAVAAGAAAEEAEAPEAPAAEAEAPAAAVGAAAVAAGAAGEEAEAPAAEAEAPAAAVGAGDQWRQVEATLGAADLGNLREKVDFIEGVGATYGATLNQAGIVTVMDLLQRGATRKGRAELVEATGIHAGLILKWVNHADLFRITGVGKQFGELLEAAGVDTVVELAQRNPVNLFTRLTQVNTETKLAGRAPRQDEVTKWVEQAKGLPRVVEY